MGNMIYEEHCVYVTLCMRNIVYGGSGVGIIISINYFVYEEYRVWWICCMSNIVYVEHVVCRCIVYE